MAVLVYADRQRIVSQAVATAGGVATATIPRPPSGFFYLIERISVRSDSALGSTATVYAGTVADLNVVDFTTSGNGDIADEDSPIYVGSAEDIIVQWTGATAGAICSTRLQVVVGKLTPGQA